MTTTSTQKGKLLGSALTDDWATCQEVFDELDKEFHFTLDACADITNHKCTRYFTIEQDALKYRWHPHVVYINPPFSKNEEFVKKAHDEARLGALCVMLIPARTQNAWFHDYVWDEHRHCTRPGVELRFLRGRIPYVGTAKGGAPFPVCVIVFNRGCS